MRPSIVAESWGWWVGMRERRKEQGQKGQKGGGGKRKQPLVTDCTHTLSNWTRAPSLPARPLMPFLSQLQHVFLITCTTYKGPYHMLITVFTWRSFSDINNVHSSHDTLISWPLFVGCFACCDRQGVSFGCGYCCLTEPSVAALWSSAFLTIQTYPVSVLCRSPIAAGASNTNLLQPMCCDTVLNFIPSSLDHIRSV